MPGRQLSHFPFLSTCDATYLDSRESSDGLPVQKMLPSFQCDIAQRRRPVADGCDDLSLLPELAHDGLAVLVRGQIEHRSVSADEEDGCELVCAAFEGGQHLRLLPQRLLRVEELHAGGVFLVDAQRIEGRRAAFGRRDGDGGDWRELFVWMGELGQVPAGRLAGLLCC